MKLTAQFQAPRISSAYREALHQSLTHALVEASKAYLHATVDTLIPVYGGASRATFFQLASHAEFALAISPVAPSTVSLGEEHGSCTWEAGPNGYSFTYTTTLPHLIINEGYDANQWGFHLRNPGPYHFQEAGAKAFQQSISTLEFPKLQLEAVRI